MEVDAVLLERKPEIEKFLYIEPRVLVYSNL